MYKVNPSSYQNVFVLPKEAVTKHLILMGEKPLKAMIYAYSEPAQDLTPEIIAEKTGMSSEDAADALKLLKNRGLLILSGEKAEILSEKEEKKEEKPEKKLPQKEAEAIPTRLSYETVCRRTEESADVRFLFSEAEAKLGRTTGLSDHSSLLLLHDYYGLPVEIILSICEYAKKQGKSSNINYIFTVGADWSKREIDTMERADEEFKNLERVNAAWRQFCALTSLKAPRATIPQMKYLKKWINDWHFPMTVIVMAYEIMREYTEKLSFSYMDKTLAAWLSKGIKTPEAVEEDKKKFLLEKEQKAVKPPKKEVKEKPQERKASYDIEEAENRAKTAVPTLRKKRGAV